MSVHIIVFDKETGLFCNISIYFKDQFENFDNGACVCYPEKRKQNKRTKLCNRKSKEKLKRKGFEIWNETGDKDNGIDAI